MMEKYAVTDVKELQKQELKTLEEKIAALYATGLLAKEASAQLAELVTRKRDIEAELGILGQ